MTQSGVVAAKPRQAEDHRHAGRDRRRSRTTRTPDLRKRPKLLEKRSPTWRLVPRARDRISTALRSAGRRLASKDVGDLRPGRWRRSEASRASTLPSLPRLIQAAQSGQPLYNAAPRFKIPPSLDESTPPVRGRRLTFAIGGLLLIQHTDYFRLSTCPSLR